ncbi:MAG: TIGR00304 family membrane protein [Candidatus Saliniplasma sp.]
MKRMLLPLILFLIGMSLIILSVITGESQLALFLIFPVIYGAGVIMIVGILMIFLSFASLFFIIPFQDDTQSTEIQKESNWGGIIFIGPIPIVMGKDRSVTKTMLYIGLIIAVIMAVIYGLIIFT